MTVTRLESPFLLAKLEELINWGRKNSIWPLQLGLACCAIEMMSTGAARFDMARFGMEIFRASPRQADLTIVAGRVSQKMGPVLKHLYHGSWALEIQRSQTHDETI